MLLGVSLRLGRLVDEPHRIHEERERRLRDPGRPRRPVLVELEMTPAEPRDREEALVRGTPEETPRVAHAPLDERDPEVAEGRPDDELTRLGRHVEELNELREAHLLDALPPGARAAGFSRSRPATPRR